MAQNISRFDLLFKRFPLHLKLKNNVNKKEVSRKVIFEYLEALGYAFDVKNNGVRKKTEYISVTSSSELLLSLQRNEPIIYIETLEEKRVMDTLIQWADKYKDLSILKWIISNQLEVVRSSYANSEILKKSKNIEEYFWEFSNLYSSLHEVNHSDYPPFRDNGPCCEAYYNLPA